MLHASFILRALPETDFFRLLSSVGRFAIKISVTNTSNAYHCVRYCSQHGSKMTQALQSEGQVIYLLLGCLILVETTGFSKVFLFFITWLLCDYDLSTDTFFDDDRKNLDTLRDHILMKRVKYNISPSSSSVERLFLIRNFDRMPRKFC